MWSRLSTDLHQLLLGAVRADNVIAIGDETATYKRCFAACANETVIMPVTVFKRDETCATDSGDRLGAGSASLGEQFPIAFGTIRLVVFGREPLSGQLVVAVSAGEALPMPRLIFVCHSAGCDDLAAFHAPRREFLLVATCTEDFLFSWDKALRANGCLAHTAGEALLVPLSGLVFHLLCPKRIFFSVAKKAIFPHETLKFLSWHDHRQYSNVVISLVRFPRLSDFLRLQLLTIFQIQSQFFV